MGSACNLNFGEIGSACNLDDPTEHILALLADNDESDVHHAFATRVKIFTNADGTTTCHSVPHGYDAAMASPDKEHYVEAMDEEMQSINDNDTYTLYPLNKVPMERPSLDVYGCTT